MVQGNLEKDISYYFGVAYSISKGSWEVAVKTILFEYQKKDPSNPNDKDPPPFNKFLFLSCNYVEEPKVIAGDQTSLEPSVLCSCHLSAIPGKKRLVSFENHDFFRVSAPTKRLTVKITDHHNQQLDLDIRKKLNLTVFFLFRRNN